MSDLDSIAVATYAHGGDPIDWACTAVGACLDARDTVREARELSPAAFPGWGERDNMAVARKIVGTLLGAGWTPPDRAVIEEALEKRAAWLRRTVAELDSGHLPSSLAAELDGMPDTERDPARWAEVFRKEIRRHESRDERSEPHDNGSEGMG